MNHRVLRISAALVCAVALFPRLPAAAADEASTLLAKHQAYVGWHEGDGVVKTMRATGVVTAVDGRTLATLSLLRYGIAQRTTSINRLGFGDDEGFTGTIYWSTGSNGFILRPVGEVAKQIYDRTALFGELTGEMTPTLLRHELVGGVDTVVLHLTSSVGFPMDVFVDPATGAYKRVIIDPAGKYELIYGAIEYVEKDGKRFLSSFRIGNSKAVYAYTKIDVNAAVTPDELHPPKQTATWTFGEGSTRVEPPNESSPQILVTVEMNGVKGKFILDTGAGGTAITESFARKIAAKPIASSELHGVTGTSAATLYRIDTMAVGSSVLHNIVVISGLREDFTQGVVGLIGYDLLAGAVVEVDLDAQTLRVVDPTKAEPAKAKGIVVRADFSDQHIRVPMKLNDRFDVIATLDSGNAANVLFSRDLVKSGLLFLVDPKSFGSARMMGGADGGTELLTCGKLGSLQLGPINYRPVPACASTFEDHNDILVGIDFMKSFNYVFDYPDGILVMIPRK